MNRIKILSLDGGGSFAAVEAKALGKLFGMNRPGDEIIAQFDVVAATSGGSVVAAALCCGFTPGEIAALYRDPDSVRRLFSPRWVAPVPGLRSILPRHSAERKRASLGAVLERHQQPGAPNCHSALSAWHARFDGKVNLIFTAFDYDRERATFFRSNMASATKSTTKPFDVSLLDAIHASTNAPIVFFDKPALIGGRRFWDGGLAGYNNPVLAGVVEALAGPRSGAPDICVLSIGTKAHAWPQLDADETPPLGRKRAGTNCIAAIKKAAIAVLSDPPDVATFHAYVALNQGVPKNAGGILDSNVPPPSDPVVRLCPLLQPEWNATLQRWQYPSGLTPPEFDTLCEMQPDAMDEASLALIAKFAERWIDGALPNQPIRSGERLRCDIGDETFAMGAARWQRLGG